MLVRSVRREVLLARRKEDFIAAISHELKTPLTGIRMYADMLREGWVATPEMADGYATRILEDDAFDAVLCLGNTLMMIVDRETLQRVFFGGSDCPQSVIDAFEPKFGIAVQGTYGLTELPTAAALENFGVEVTFPPRQMSSEGLLQMHALQSVTGDNVLIVRGEGGRTTLRETLLARGARVDDLPCYRRTCPVYTPGSFLAALEKSAVRLLVITSSEGLVNLLALLSPEETTNLQFRTLLVSSERVAEQAAEAGFKDVRIARNASDAAIVDAVLQWQKDMGER